MDHSNTQGGNVAEKNTETTEDQSEHLLNLAAKLDSASGALRGQILNSGESGGTLELTESEQEELNRIRDALDFIHQVCPPRDKKSSNSLKETPVTQLATPLATPTGKRLRDKSSTDHPEQVGRFQINRLLGKGGFAKVFLAYDPQLNRDVALKLLRNGLFDSEDVTNRFDREAQAAAILSHPGIVPVFESGEIDGQRYIASAYCEGTTLERWAKNQAEIKPATAASIIIELADAVEHAHQRGIIHRDLKPANVLVVQAGQDSVAPNEGTESLLGQLRIADFGLAKHAGTTDQMQTAEGAIVGTPAYMSPEQADGNANVESTSDIYSLGVIFFELLTGELPIVGRSNIDTLLAIATQQPKSPRSIRKSIPRDLEAICLKCLSKKPVQRYATAHELASDLRRWMGGETVVARNATQIEKAGKWIARNPGLASTMALVTTAMLITFFQWRNAISENRRAETNYRLAVAENERAEKHLKLSQEVIDQMVVKVASDNRLPAELRRSIAEKATEFQEQLFNDERQDEDVVAQTMLSYNRTCRLLFNLNAFEDALQMAEKSIAASDEMLEVPRIAELRASASQIKADVLRAMNRIAESEATIRESEAATEQSDLKKAGNRFSIAMARLAERQFNEANEAFQSAFELINRAGNVHTQLLKGRILFFWGRSEMELNHFEEAKSKTDQALAIFESMTSKHSKIPAVIEEIGRCHVQSAEVLRKGLDAKIAEDPEFPLDQREATWLLAIDHSEKVIERYTEVRDLNPLAPRSWGLLAYGHHLKIHTLVELGMLEEVQDALLVFREFEGTVDPKNTHRDDIRASYVACRLELVKLLKTKEMWQLAKKETEAATEDCRNFCEQANPETRAELDVKMGECEAALKQLNEQLEQDR